MTRGDMPAQGPLRVVDATGSTNDDVRALAAAGAPHGSAVAAHAQTAGRGRRGHVWHSPEGGLYLSVLLRPQVPMQMFVGLPALCALACVRALREVSGRADVAVKWPNDVVVDIRKLAGVLVEAGSGPEGPYAVVGVGLNVARPQDAGSEASEGLGQAGAGESARPLSPVWLSELAPGACAFDMLAERLRAAVVAACDEWEGQVRAGRAKAGPLAPFLPEYFDCCAMLGRRVVALTPAGEEVVRGAFCAVDVWGRATVHADDGRDLEFSAEQVSLRPA